MSKVSPKSKSNLIPLTERSPEEAREIRKKGAKALAVKIRQKKTWKELANIILSTKVKDKKKLDKLQEFNITKADANLDAILMSQVVQKALDGDLYSIQFLQDLTGNKESTKIDMSVTPVQIKVDDDYGE